MNRVSPAVIALFVLVSSLSAFPGLALAANDSCGAIGDYDSTGQYRSCLEEHTTKAQVLEIVEHNPDDVTKKQVDRVYAFYPARADELNDEQEKRVVEWQSWEMFGIEPGTLSETSNESTNTANGEKLSRLVNETSPDEILRLVQTRPENLTQLETQLVYAWLPERGGELSSEQYGRVVDWMDWEQSGQVPDWFSANEGGNADNKSGDTSSSRRQSTGINIGERTEVEGEVPAREVVPDGWILGQNAYVADVTWYPELNAADIIIVTERPLLLTFTDSSAIDARKIGGHFTQVKKTIPSGTHRVTVSATVSDTDNQLVTITGAPKNTWVSNGVVNDGTDLSAIVTPANVAVSSLVGAFTFIGGIYGRRRYRRWKSDRRGARRWF